MRSIEAHGNKYDYSKTKYTKATQKVIITCPIHGDFLQSPFDHLDGKGCNQCGNEHTGFLKRQQASSVFEQKAKSIHGDKYDYSKVVYKDALSKVEIICPTHGSFFQSATHHLSGAGCPLCRESLGETKVRTFLERHNILYIREHCVILPSSCKCRQRAFVDFFIPALNTFIEFNGIQHYKTINRFHRDEWNLEDQQERDNALVEYCNRNGIYLVVIKYTDIKSVDDILTSELLMKL